MRGFARSAERVRTAGVELDDLVLGDATTGDGLERALDGIEVAYYLIHSMEGVGGTFVDTERLQAERFAEAAAAAGVRRIVYLGGLIPHDGSMSRHLGPASPSSRRCWTPCRSPWPSGPRSSSRPARARSGSSCG